MHTSKLIAYAKMALTTSSDKVETSNSIFTLFSKLDKSGDGIVTVDDLRGVYQAQHHKKFKSGEYTEGNACVQFRD